jgi:hypothetical protein
LTMKTKECVWLLRMWVRTPSEKVVGVYTSEAKAQETAHAMKTKINDIAEYEVDCFYLDVGPVDFEAIKR